MIHTDKLNTRHHFITWSTSQVDQPHITLLSANDVELITQEYGALVDLSSTSFHVSFGNRNPKLINAIAKQLNSFATAPPKFEHSLKSAVSLELKKLLKLESGKIFYTVSGAEAIENALKMARQVSGKKYIGALKKSYHGATLGALSVTGDWRHDEHFHLGEYTLRLPDPLEDPDGQLTIKTIENFGAKKIAALCLETISGGNGVFSATKKWWQEVQKTCRKYQIYLILDEVVCGFYRTGKAFGFHHYNIKPDFVALSKSITGGHIPFGALWVGPTISEYFDHRKFSYGLTQYAHPLGLAATQAVIKLVQSQSWKTTYQKNLDVFKHQLKEIKKCPAVKNVRFKGLLGAVELNSDITPEFFYEHGLFISLTNKNMIILAPATTFRPKKLEKALVKLSHLLKRQI